VPYRTALMPRPTFHFPVIKLPLLALLRILYNGCHVTDNSFNMTQPVFPRMTSVEELSLGIYENWTLKRISGPMTTAVTGTQNLK
jgi:hypothetical protein